MDLLKEIFIDSLNGFPVKYIPLFIFQLLTAGLIGFVVQFLFKKKWGNYNLEQGILIAVGIATITSIVKYSLPFAIMGAVVVLLLTKNKKYEEIDVLGLVLLGIAGVGCGVGSVIQTIIAFTVIFLIIVFTPVKK